MTKQTYQPKKRHRAKEHGFRARMKYAGWPQGPRRPACKGAQEADRLRWPRDPPARRWPPRDAPLGRRLLRSSSAHSRSRAHPLMIVRFRRNGLERTRYGISTGRKPRVGGRSQPACGVGCATILRGLEPRVVRPGWDILLVRPAGGGRAMKQADSARSRCAACWPVGADRGDDTNGETGSPCPLGVGPHPALPDRVRLCRLAAGSSRAARATRSRRSSSTACCGAAGWAPSASPAAIRGTRAATTRCR